MASNRAQARLTEWFALADIQINGDRPWDIAVHNDEFYQSVPSPAGPAMRAGHSKKRQSRNNACATPAGDPKTARRQ